MNLPAEFEERTKAVLKEEFDDFLLSLDEPPPVSIRLNNKLPLHPSDQQVLWNTEGYYLAERPLFTADPLLHAGAYYVQEASSMFLAQIVKICFPEAETVLDLCAAPGGKSTLLAQCLPDNTLLVSNEIVRSRAHILAENLTKWGNHNIMVTNNKPDDFSELTHFFDAIVIDAPCSGEGMFRKDPGAIAEWSKDNVMLCAKRQKDIISSIWNALKPNGILVYSTCTYNIEENEDNIGWICENFEAEKINIDIPAEWGITATSLGYRFYPHKIKGEGFFISIIKKKNEPDCLPFKIPSIKGTNFVNENSTISLYLKNADRFKIFIDNNLLRAFPAGKTEEYLFLYRKLNFVDGGILLAEVKGKDYIPSPQLALSKSLDTEKVLKKEVDYDTAIKYLRKEAIYLNDLSKGYILITYKGIALGWVKNLGNRTNNLFPQNWRIRMQL
jgi:16S rRNA C967 or C1407 C5-methylase (RsmB/RsmF family)/NOL1/NOP2/fmu family ribosome biogenesis protein